MVGFGRLLGFWGSRICRSLKENVVTVSNENSYQEDSFFFSIIVKYCNI